MSETIQVPESVEKALSEEKPQVTKSKPSTEKPKAKLTKTQKARAKAKTGAPLARREKQTISKARRSERKSKRKARAAKPKIHGPAYAIFKKKLRERWEPGHCMFKGCSKKPPTSRSRYCQTHYKEYRKVQLAENNKVWRKRIDAGKALHHVIYNGELTEWSKKNIVAARRLVSDGKSVADREEFEKAVAKWKATAAKEAAKTKAA